MIRIEIDDRSNITTLYVEGRIAGADVDELRRVWVANRNGTPAKQTVIDLCSVRGVDSNGRQLLGEMHSWGTRLAGNGLIIRPLIQEIITNDSFVETE